MTVITDRYGGTYSRATCLAFPVEYNFMPMGPEASDAECCRFWQGEEDIDYFIGKGAMPNEAAGDLIQKYADQYLKLGGQPEELCEILDHDLRYNFANNPSKCICARCHKKFRADYSGGIINGNIWKEVESFEGETRTDEELCRAWR